MSFSIRQCRRELFQNGFALVLPYVFSLFVRVLPDGLALSHEESFAACAADGCLLARAVSASAVGPSVVGLCVVGLSKVGPFAEGPHSAPRQLALPLFLSFSASALPFHEHIIHTYIQLRQFALLLVSPLT